MLMALRDRVAAHGHADKARELDSIIEHALLALAALEPGPDASALLKTEILVVALVGNPDEAGGRLLDARRDRSRDAIARRRGAVGSGSVSRRYRPGGPRGGQSRPAFVRTAVPDPMPRGAALRSSKGNRLCRSRAPSSGSARSTRRTTPRPPPGSSSNRPTRWPCRFGLAGRGQARRARHREPLGAGEWERSQAAEAVVNDLALSIAASAPRIRDEAVRKISFLTTYRAGFATKSAAAAAMFDFAVAFDCTAWNVSLIVKAAPGPAVTTH